MLNCIPEIRREFYLHREMATISSFYLRRELVTIFSFYLCREPATTFSLHLSQQPKGISDSIWLLFFVSFLCIFFYIITTFYEYSLHVIFLQLFSFSSTLPCSVPHPLKTISKAHNFLNFYWQLLIMHYDRVHYGIFIYVHNAF